MDEPIEKHSDDLWEHLVVAVLSVNQYSLERTYGSIQGLRSEKLVDPRNLSLWTVREIEERLKAAGCDRGDFMTRLFSQRLHSLGKHVEGRGFRICEEILRTGERRAIDNLLAPVNGIGPVVLKHFRLLRGLPEPA